MKGEHTTGSLVQCWQVNYSLHHIAISPYPADGIPSTFCCYLHHHFFNRLRSGLDIIKYQHSSKLCPLVATALLTMKHIIILFLVVPLSSLAQKSHICTYQDNFGTRLEIRSDLVRRGDSCNSNPATDGKPHRWQQ